MTRRRSTVFASKISPSAGASALLLVSLARCSADVSSSQTFLDESCQEAICLRVGHCLAGQSSAQFRSQRMLPVAVPPSTRLPVRVTFDNCSGVRWSRDEFSLTPVDVEEGSAWSVRRVPLPEDVPNGAEVTLNFEIQAPLATGLYPVRWAISRDRVEVLQQHTPTQNVQVLAPADCSQAGARVRFRSQMAPPDFLAVRQSFHATVTFSNCNSETLRARDGWALASRSDPESTWGPTEIALPGDVPPGAEIAFDLDLTAPSLPGRYRYGWQVVANGMPVGEASPVLYPTVLVPADCNGATVSARFVRQSLPPEILDPNQAADARVTYANCGDEPWDERTHLDTALDGAARRWNSAPIDLPYPVGVGFAVEIPFRVRAPSAPGRYPYRWRLTNASGALDEPTPPVELTVRCIPNCGDHNCGGDGCGGSCGACPGGWGCDGAHCQPPDRPVCSALQWWNSRITYEHISSGWHDTDLSVRSGTPVQLRHTSRLERTGVYGWGYMPEFTDLATGARYRLLHLRPQNQWATSVGRVYPAGFIAGLSGGDTRDTGYPAYSTGQHLCIQTLRTYRDAFPGGSDACR